MISRRKADSHAVFREANNWAFIVRIIVAVISVTGLIGMIAGLDFLLSRIYDALTFPTRTLLSVLESVSYPLHYGFIGLWSYMNVLL